MTTFKDQFSKLTREQQLAAIQQMHEALGTPAAGERDAQRKADLARMPSMTNNEFEQWKIDIVREGNHAAADRDAQRAAESRGFEVTKKE